MTTKKKKSARTPWKEGGLPAFMECAACGERADQLIRVKVGLEEKLMHCCDHHACEAYLRGVHKQVVEDAINHPAHYTSHPSGVECIDVTEHMTFNCGNATKYIWRAGLKDSSPKLEDLKKARWYVDREISRLEKEGKR